VSALSCRWVSQQITFGLFMPSLLLSMSPVPSRCVIVVGGYIMVFGGVVLCPFVGGFNQGVWLGGVLPPGL